MEHDHHHEAHDHGSEAPTSLEFIVHQISTGPDTVLVRYDCPCGCKPSAEYERDSQESDFEACCCGNVHFVGPNSQADLEHYLADRGTRGEDDDVGGYEIHRADLAAPWGGAISVTYGLPHQSRKH